MQYLVSMYAPAVVGAATVVEATSEEEANRLALAKVNLMVWSQTGVEASKATIVKTVAIK